MKNRKQPKKIHAVLYRVSLLNRTLKESFVLLSGCLQMMKVRRRHTMKMTVRSMMFHVAKPPCTASILNTRINVPAGGTFIFIITSYR